MKTLLTALILTISSPAYSWSGYDVTNNQFIEIERGNTVRKHREIDIYTDTGEYSTGEVESITSRGNRVDIEVYDSVTGEIRVLEMRGK